MKARANWPELNGSELGLMKLLWREGPLSAREAHDRAGASNDWAYSTTRTVLERMVGKGLIEKKVFHGLNLYAAAISRPVGLARLVRDFADRVLELDWAPVVSLFGRSEALTEAEIAELSRLLEEGEEEQESQEEVS